VHIHQIADGQSAANELHREWLAGRVDAEQVHEVRRYAVGLVDRLGHVARAVVFHEVDQLVKLAVDEGPCRVRSAKRVVSRQPSEVRRQQPAGAEQASTGDDAANSHLPLGVLVGELACSQDRRCGEIQIL
jgi:hypothetical protein